MITGIEIITRDQIATMEVRENAPMWKMPMVVGRSYKGIMEYLQRQQAQPSGMPYVRYVGFDWDQVNKSSGLLGFLKGFTTVWKMHIGFPVQAPLQGSGNIEAGSIAQGRYLKALHVGPYRKVGEAYKALLAYRDENKLRFKPESIEFYHNDPRTTKSQDLKTEILIPLAE